MRGSVFYTYRHSQMANCGIRADILSTRIFCHPREYFIVSVNFGWRKMNDMYVSFVDCGSEIPDGQSRGIASPHHENDFERVYESLLRYCE